MKKFIMIFGALLVVSSIILTLAGCSNSTTTTTTTTTTPTATLSVEDQNYTIQFGYYNCDHMTAGVIAKDAGIFSDLGLKVKVTGNGQVPQAMTAGQMDVGLVGTTTIMNAAQKGAPVKVVAGNFLGGSYYLVASNAITDAKDLVGKRVSLGTDPEKTSLHWCEMADALGIPRDGSAYNNVTMASDSAKYTAMAAGQLDGYLCCDPWASMAVVNKVGHILTVYTKLPDGWGDCCDLSMSTKFMTDHPELAKRMILAQERALEYIYVHPIKSANIFATEYQVPVDVALQTIWRKTTFEGRTLVWYDNTQGIINEMETGKKMGLASYQTYYAVDQWTDFSLLKQTKVDDFDTFIKTKVDNVFPVGMTYQDWYTKAQQVDGK
jgi:NitT/TauT family transport system substrate-binding protein